MSNDIDSLRTSSNSVSPQHKLFTTTTTATAVAISTNGSSNGHYKNIFKPTKYSDNHNRRYRKSTVYINIIFILIVFVMLIQIFDPAIQNPIPDNDVLHQHIRNQQPLTNTRTTESSKQAKSSSKNYQQNDRIISLLKDAGIIDELSDAQRQHVPRWDQVRRP